MRFRFPTIAALFVLMLFSQVARAEYQYVFTNTSGTVETGFSVAVGSTVQIQVYLVQTTGTELSSSGLSSAGVTLNYNSSVATINSAANVAANPSFQVSAPTVATNTTTLSESNIVPPAVPATTGNYGTGVLLGTFTFTGVSSTAGSPTPGQTLTVASVPTPNDPPNYNVAGDGTVLDGMIAGASATITVTPAAIPEPGTMALSAFGAFTMLGGVWYRRKRQPAKPS